MAITTMDGLVTAIASAQIANTNQPSIASKAAGSWASLWTAGGAPTAGAAAGSAGGAVCTNTTTGAIPYTNPSGSNTLYLARLQASGAVAGTFMLYDRLVHTSTLSGTVTTAQTVGSVALTRYTSGAGVQLWIEVYTATGATGVTATVSYTNQAGTSGRSGTAAIPVTTVAGQLIPVTLASGDTGVQAVASVTLSATTGTAGNFGITLGYPIASVPINLANTGQVLDYAGLGLPVVQTNATPSNACLAYAVLCSTTTTGLLQTQLTLAQG